MKLEDKMYNIGSRPNSFLDTLLVLAWLFFLRWLYYVPAVADFASCELMVLHLNEAQIKETWKSIYFK